MPPKSKKQLSKVEYLEKIKSKPMPKGAYSWLEYANPDMAWMCFREDAIRSLFDPKFCGIPYIEYATYFALGNVFYKKRENLERLGLKRAEIRYVDKLSSFFSSKNQILSNIMNEVIEQKDYEGKHIPQYLKYKVAEVHHHNLKSCEIRFTKCMYRAIQELPVRKLVMNLKRDRLEGMRYMYIVSDTLVADVKLTVHVGQKVNKKRWKNVVIAFILSKYQVNPDGHIGNQVKTNYQKRTLIKANSWWVPRDLKKRIQKRAEFTGEDIFRKVPERQFTEETLHAEWNQIPDLVKKIQTTEHGPIINIVYGDRSWRVSDEDREMLKLAEDQRDSATAKPDPLPKETSDEIATGSQKDSTPSEEKKLESKARKEDKSEESDEPDRDVMLNESYGKNRQSENIVFSEEINLQEKDLGKSTDWSSSRTKNLHAPKGDYATDTLKNIKK